ncbi:splicing factor 3b subunit 1 SF3b1 [Gracilaria domingensis]|nr:splicing factor 3b subunit 1 SF3b1 [Gracilaria domingensis]
MPRSTRDSEQGASTGVAFGTEVAGFDEELYDSSGPLRNRKGYVSSINPSDVEADKEQKDELEAAFLASKKATAASITAPKYLIAEAEAASAKLNPQDPFKPYMPKTIAEQQNSYLARGRKRVLSPLRAEHAANIAKQTTVAKQSSSDVEQRSESAEVPVSGNRPPRPNVNLSQATPTSRPKRRRRWDVVADTSTTDTQITAEDTPMPLNATPVPDTLPPSAPQTLSKPTVPTHSRWDAPVPTSTGASRSSRWDATPGSMSISQVTKKSRWDETPLVQAAAVAGATPMVRAGSAALSTPFLQSGSPDAVNLSRWQGDIEMRNRPLTDEELDELLPSAGYTILEPPDSYKPVETPARLLMKTSAVPQTPLYSLPTENGFARETLGIPVEMPDALKSIEMKPEDYKNFARVLDKNSKDEDLPAEEQVERKVMRLLLKIKNGTPNVRKVAMRQISEKARDFGAEPLLKQILPLLMSPTLEHQERHLYVKVIDRILHKLRDLVRPHVRHILVVIEPMLIDDDYYARVEGREIISNLAKAAGLPTMISTMRPDIDHQDEFA